MASPPDSDDAARRARTRTALIFAGLFDLALAGFFLGWGASVLQLEYRMAWMIAAVLAAGGVGILFVATLAFGHRGSARGLDEPDDRPVIRR